MFLRSLPSPGIGAARLAATVAACFVAVSVAVVALFAPQTEHFLGANQMLARERSLAVAIVVVTALTSFTGTLVMARRFDERTLGAVRRGVLQSAPLGAAIVIPALFSHYLWKEGELRFLIVTAGCGLLLEKGLVRVLTGPRSPREAAVLASPAIRTLVPSLLTAAFVLYYFVVIARGTLLSHERMATLTSDLGEFDNLFFNALSGRPFRAPAIAGDTVNFSALKVHAEFILYLLLPFYALKPGPQALLVIQTAVIALGAVPVALLAARRLGPAYAPLFAAVYLLLPAVQRPNFYDFHFPPVGAFFAAWTIYLADRVVNRKAGEGVPRRVDHVGLGVATLLTLLCREEFSVGIAVIGLVISFGDGRTKAGPALFGAGLAYFVIVKFVLMPRFGVMWFDAIYSDLKAPGHDGFASVILTLVTNPFFVVSKLMTTENLLYVLHLAVPLLGLWLRRPWLLAAALPGFAFTLLVTNRSYMHEVSFQYVYFWVPYVVCASIFGLEALFRISRARGLAAATSLVLVALACSHQHGALFGQTSIVGGFGPKALVITEGEKTRIADLRELVRTIPPQASVGATEREGPHVSTRTDLFSLKISFGDPEYLLLGPLGTGEEKAHVKKALEGDTYGLLATRGEFMLLQRGADPARNGAVRALLAATSTEGATLLAERSTRVPSGG